MAVFRKFKGINIKYSHRDPPKGTSLPGTTSFDVFLRKNLFKGVGCSLIEEPKKRTYSHPKSTAKSRIWGAETPEPIATKFFVPAAIQDIITHANFGYDRLRGFGVANGRILAFPIDLPCECVIPEYAIRDDIFEKNLNFENVPNIILI